VKVIESRGGLRHIRRHYITYWHENSRYIESLVETIEAAYVNLPDPTPGATHLLFSAHSIPATNIAEGDPYLAQTQRTVELVMKQLSGNRPYTLSFQSKVGPVKWLEPSSDQTI